MKNITKPGPKTKDKYICTCCDSPQSFVNSKKKCDHERNSRKRQSKTEVGTTLGDRDTSMEDLNDFEASINIGPPTNNTLKLLSKSSIQSNCSAFFKPKIITEYTITSTLQPQTTCNEQDILMEKESFEEETKQIQGSSSQSSQQSDTSQYAKESLQDLSRQLNMSKGWKEIEEMVRLGAFERIAGLQPSRDLYISFLIQGCSLLKTIPNKFPSALAVAYKWLFDREAKIPCVITEEYKIFFTNYKGHKAQRGQQKRDHIEELRALFKFCRKLRASVEWIKYLQEPDLLMGEAALLMGCTTSLRLLFECNNHYSHDYFALIDYIIEQTRLADRNVEGFVHLLKVPSVIVDGAWKELFQHYARTENIYSKAKVIKIGGQILGVVTKPITCSLLMDIVEVAIALNKCEEIKTVLKSEQHFTNIKEFKGLLNLQLKKKQLKQAFANDQQHEDAKKELKLKQEEEIKLKSEAKEEKKMKELEIERVKESKHQQQVRIEMYHQLCELNDTTQDDNAFLQFSENIITIAAELPIPLILRPEQLATMFLLLHSKKQLTLAELATGIGKSVMLALMAQFLKLKGKKVLVLVPSKVLKLDQTRCYCPNYCKAQAELYDSNTTNVYYQTFEEVLDDGRVPSQTVIFIDEFHHFMKLPVAMTKHGLSCPYIFVTSQQVIGVSATFGGLQVKIDNTKLFPNLLLLNVPQQQIVRQLNISVQGNLDRNQIFHEAAAIAKHEAANMPVIIFCDDQRELKNLIDGSIVFEGEPGEKLSMLTVFKTSSVDPNYIVIATEESVLGLTLFNRAYIIFTSAPNSLSDLRQMAGRGEREDINRAIKGTMLTTKFYTNINDFEVAVADAEEKQRSLRLDYHQSLSYLQKCVPATEPQMKALTQAITSLNERKSYQEIIVILSKTAFKNVLKQSPKKREDKAQAKFDSSLQKIKQVNGLYVDTVVHKEEKQSPSKKQDFGQRGIQKEKTTVSSMLGTRLHQKRENTNNEESFGSYSAYSSSKESQFLKRQKQYTNMTPEAAPQQEVEGLLNEAGGFIPSVAMAAAVNNQDQEEVKAGDSTFPPPKLTAIADNKDSVSGKRSNSNKFQREFLSENEQILFAKNKDAPLGVSSTKKRVHKAETVFGEKDTEINRTIKGRFEAKYKIGDKTSSGNLIKEVSEEDWKFIEKDKYSNSYYKCVRCTKACRVLKGDRKKHSCKFV